MKLQFTARQIAKNGVCCDEDGYDDFFPSELKTMKKTE